MFDQPDADAMFLEMLENPGAIIAIGCSNGSWVSPAFVVLLSAVLHASRRHFESVTLIFVVRCQLSFNMFNSLTDIADPGRGDMPFHLLALRAGVVAQ